MKIEKACFTLIQKQQEVEAEGRRMLNDKQQEKEKAVHCCVRKDHEKGLDQTQRAEQKIGVHGCSKTGGAGTSCSL